MPQLAHCAVALLAGALAGCAHTGERSPAPLPASPALQRGAFLRAPGGEKAAPLGQWWKALNDPQLDALIEAGLANAPGIAAAQARVRQARAGLAGSRAGLRPAIGASATAAAAELPDAGVVGIQEDTGAFLAGFDARWELDLWGARRRATAQQRAEAEMAEALLADAQVQLTAEIARTYVELRRQQVTLQLLKTREAAEGEIVRLAEQRFRAGTIPRQPWEMARQRRELTGGLRAVAEGEELALRDVLAVLTGRAPGALEELPPRTIPLPPGQVAVGDPAAMLARRPDIRAAERRLAAADAAIALQEARRFPSLSLFGLIGIGGLTADGAPDPVGLTALAVPRLSWNFLDFGRTAAAVRGAEAGRDLALAEYHDSILAALRDAEAALARFAAARTALAQTASAAVHARTIADLQRQRAEAGAISIAERLETDIARLNAQIMQAEREAGLTATYIALAKALGLGWDVGGANPASD